MRNPTATDFETEPEKFLFRSVWTLAARSGVRFKLKEIMDQCHQLNIHVSAERLPAAKKNRSIAIIA
jgi:hypothetical protein